MQTEEKTLGWWFCADKMRDGRPIPADGETLTHDGPLVPCRSGLHYSEHVFDALKYAPGYTLCRVECGGEQVSHGDPVDKHACRERTIVQRIDARSLIRSWARWCALQVIHLWDAPSVVVEYLRTGDESLLAAAMDAARAAASAAAMDAASSAAMDAFWDAVSAAAMDAARAAAMDASWDAARAAAMDAAKDAAWGASCDASRDAVWGAAWNAPMNAAWYAAWDAAWDAQCAKLDDMAEEAMEGLTEWRFGGDDGR